MASLAYKAEEEHNANSRARRLLYAEEAALAAKYLVSRVSNTGYVSASSEYFWYKPHWFRDSSFIAISLLDFASYFKNAYPELAGEARNAAHRINEFNLKAVEHYAGSLKRAVSLAYEDPEFYKMSSHMPARVNESFELFNESGENGRFINDVVGNNRWLIQYDTLPLVLLAVYEEKEKFGLSETETRIIRDNGRLLVNYLGKIYQTPASEAWETPETEYIYSYNIAAIFKAKQLLEGFAESGMIDMRRDEIESAFNFLYTRGGIIGALKDVENNRILYSRRLPFNGPDTAFGVDAEELFVFTRFSIGSTELGEGVEEATMKKIEDDLFGGNLLPIRNTHDEYFCGGRWLLLGLEYAIYKARRGQLEEAEKRISYISSKYADSMPEQEIVNPAHPESASGKNDLQRNNGMPIQKLNWSYAAFISAVIELNESTGREAFSLRE
ncbi:MAG: hypothetical protein ACP5T3_00075 [Candidatus Micrarchaeia archaeon]